MAKFRKKPVVIEATQWFKHGDHPMVVRGLYTPEGIVTGFTNLALWEDAFGVTEVFGIPTLEGFMEASPGDWIITGIQGEHYPCKPEIFTLTYEAVSE